MHYDVNYSGRNDADRAALLDMVKYIGWKQFRRLRRLAQTNTPFKVVCFWIEMNGVAGFPVHAFGRRYATAKYEAWMAEP